MNAILEALGPDKDATIEEVRHSLAEQGLFFGFGTIQRFFARHNITRKKERDATEQDRPDILKRRQEWFDGQLDLDPARLVLSTRDLGTHQYGAPSWPVHERRASEDQRSSRPLENYNLHRSADATRFHRTLRHRQADQP